MDKRQRLRVKTPESSAILPGEIPTIDMTQDSSIIYPQKITADAGAPRHPEIKDENSLDFTTFDEKSGGDEEVAPELPQTQSYNTFVEKIKKYWAFPVIFLILVFFNMKPSDHQFLIDELEKIKKQNVATHPNIKQVENILSISNGVTISNYSPVYKYGFFKSSMSDPNSIIEPGLDNLPLAGQSGFFEIKLGNRYSVRKIGLYHPETANSKSAIKDFSVIVNEKVLDYTFSGKGYQEFAVDGIETDTIRIEYINNHGESKYTCIYRVFVFA